MQMKKLLVNFTFPLLFLLSGGIEGHEVEASTYPFNHVSPSTLQDLTDAILHLIGDQPTAIIMDNRRLESIEAYWTSLKLAHNSGVAFFVYHSFLESSSNAKVKPFSSRTPLRYISHTWAFICFLDVSHSTTSSLDRYLKRLLDVGNGAVDNFIFLGVPQLLDKLLGHPTLRKFRNVVGIYLNTPDFTARFRKSCDGQTTFTSTSNLYEPKWIPRRFNCLNGNHFDVAGTDFPPYMFYILPEVSPSGMMEYDGTHYRILANGARRYNYTISVNNPSSWKLTGDFVNGTWNGIFGELVYGDVEIASVSNPTVKRRGWADFVGPFGKSNLIFVSANPLAYAKSVESWIFHPFTPRIWAMIVVGFFLVFLLNSAILKYRYMLGKERYNDSFKKALTITMAFTLEQEIGKPRGFLSRFLMVLWVVSMIIVGTSYKYNLTAFILAPQRDYVPTSFDELYYLKEYRIIFDLGGYSGWAQFSNNPHSRIRALVPRTTTTEDTCYCAVKAFQEINTVCAGWDMTLKFAASKNLTISVGREPLYRSSTLFDGWFVIAIENQSIYTVNFQRIGTAFYEVGLIHRWEKEIILNEKWRGRKWLYERKNTPLFRQLHAYRMKFRNNLKKLSLKNLEFVFVILAIGIAAASAVFVVELCKRASCFKRFIHRRNVRIRKISDIVKRKISQTAQARIKEDDEGNLIVVTFLP